MKTAWAYLRISQEEQSFYSISGQKKDIEYYAQKNNLNITQFFMDEESAKSFNRTEWIRLEQQLKLKQNRPDFLIVWSFDRLIRNAMEGLTFWQVRLKKYGVRLLSVREYSNLNDSEQSASEFKRTADALVTAEYERLRISERTRMGMYNASMEGRYLHKAPYGYKNSRDKENRPLLVIDNHEAKIIQEIFARYIAGHSFIEIRKWAVEKGLHLKHKEIVQRILSNEVYIGRVKLRGTNEKKTVRGIHEPIIEENIFWQVQSKLNARKRHVMARNEDEIPLRGVLLCQSCGKLHTGGRSKGRNAYYWYYNCNHCMGENYSSIIAHQQLEKVWSGLSLSRDVIPEIMGEMENQINEQIHKGKYTLERGIENRSQIKQNIEKLEKKYLFDETIDKAVYSKWMAELNVQLAQAEKIIAEHERNENEVWKLYNEHLPLLSDINYLYQKSNVNGKQELVRNVFLGGLIKFREGYRTKYIHPLFANNAENVSHLQIKTEAKIVSISTSVPFGVANGI